VRWLKAWARGVLERGGWDDRFRDSAIYGAYLSLRHPAHAASMRRVDRFYRTVLSEAGRGLVLDIGANRGDRTRIFAAHADRVVSVEPNAFCHRRLTRRFQFNPRVTLVQAGVGESAGVKPFLEFDEEGSAYNTFSQKWASAQADRAVKAAVDMPVTTLDALIAEYGRPSYIKIDVEGSELDVIRGLSTPVPLLSVECILPEFLAESLELVDLLGRRFPGSRFNYSVGDSPQAFEEPEWVSAGAMADILNRSQRRFIEVYCRSAEV
jgi:FkbM family methyltransferase